MNQITIPAAELVSMELPNGHTNQIFLAMLRDRGAPIAGYFRLHYSDDYTFTHLTDTDTGAMTIRWTPRQVADGAA